MNARLVTVLILACAVAGCAVFGKSVGKVPDNAGILAVKCNVAGADVYIDKALVGTIQKADSRQDIVVASGEHDLLVKKFGYEDYKETISLVPGARNTIDVNLERTPTKAVSVQ